MSKNCINERTNLSRCNCTYGGCPRHGSCCDCLHYHLASQELPACCFPAEVEKTWDRSFARFIRTYSPR